MFSPPTNSGLKKKDVSLLPGEGLLPVYSATKEEDLVFGWIREDSKWRKYEDVLTWNKDGSASVFYRQNRFIPYEKVKILEIKSEFKGSIDYNFLKYSLMNAFEILGFGFNNKCSMERVLKVEINIPVDEHDNFDMSAQIELTDIFKVIIDLKEKVTEYNNSLLSMKIEVE